MNSLPGHRLRGVWILVVALLPTAIGCELITSSKEEGETLPRRVYSMGRLEPASGVINIRATPGDRLVELRVLSAGDIVPSDGILGLLSSYEMGKAQLSALLEKKKLAAQKHYQQKQLAKAQVAQAIASQAQTKARQTELALQAGKLDALSVARDLAESEFVRLKKLRSSDLDLVTQHQLDKQKNRMELASQDYTIASESHKSATVAAELAVLAANANLSVAEITRKQATTNFEEFVIQQEIKVAREALKRSILLAPYQPPNALQKLLLLEDSETDPSETEDSKLDDTPQYTVLSVALHQGEVVTPAAVMQLGDLREMVCIAEVYEADVQELYEGQAVTIRSPAFSGKFADGKIDPKTKRHSGGIQGHVKSIGKMVAPPGLSNRNPLAPTDRSVVEVLITIDDNSGDGETAIQHAAEKVSLKVTVEFEVASDAKEKNKPSQSAEAAEQEKPETDNP